jgi:error-prone DNA polymerase
MGLTGAEREETWMMVEKFAGFGFCKAHAATYADISYRMTYLKTHHTAEFLAAMCSAGAGFYHVSAYVEEAKRWGITVRLPSVNRSRMEYSTEPAAEGKRALRVGLMQVKGLRIETIVAIMREREAHGAFRSLQDFLARIPTQRDEIEALIKCGALDDVGNMTRPAMLWQWNLLQAKGVHMQAPLRAVCAAATAGAGAAMPAVLFAAMEHDDSIAMALREIDTADYLLEQKLRYEREILEVCVSGHPLDFLPRQGETWSDELPQRHGKRVTLCGWVVTYRHVGTKNYRNMMFVTLEDQRGLFEAILFPDAYDKFGGLVYETRAMRVTGVVQDGEHINAESLERLKS